MATVLSPRVCPGPVAAWLGPSQIREPALALAARFLHGGILRNPHFKAAIYSRFGSHIWLPGSCFFSDYEYCIFTFALSQDVRLAEAYVEGIGDLWVEYTESSVVWSISAIDRWIIRQYEYQFGRPCGSRLFARLREPALFDGDIRIAARPDLLAERVFQLVERSAATVISAVVRGRRVSLPKEELVHGSGR